MKNSFKLYVCLLVIFFAEAAALCQQYDKVFDALLTKQLSGESPGGTALVAKDGKVIYEKSFGKADLELDVEMKPGMVFRMGSLTKQFTAAAILKLAEEGKLSLHDSITKFIRDYPTHGYTITIEHLLTHTSGVKNYTSISKWTPEVRKKDFNPKELVDFFRDEPMDFAPGKEFRYSNSGYILLGYIIELVSGKSYGQYIEENFFKPLGMKNSSYDYTSRIIPDRVSGYQKRNGHFENAEYLSMTLPYSAGSLLSNAGDLLIWYNALMSNSVLNKKSVDKAHTPFKLNDGQLTGYGYGWVLGNIQGSPSIKHMGNINGFVTFAMYLPNEKIFVTLLSNCDCSGDLENPASKMAAIVMSKPYELHKTELDKKKLESYKGAYVSAFSGKKIVSFEDGRLLYFSKGGSKVNMVPFGVDKFYLENSLTSLEFVRNHEGRIVSFSLKSTDTPVEYLLTDEEIKTLNPTKMTNSALEKYTGNYQFSPEVIFSVVKEGDKMYGQVKQDRKEIMPYGKHQFFARDLDAKIIFNVDKKGKVVSLIKIQGGEMIAKRIELINTHHDPNPGNGKWLKLVTK